MPLASLRQVLDHAAEDHGASPAVCAASMLCGAGKGRLILPAAPQRR